jgi:hypothetical protein
VLVLIRLKYGLGLSIFLKIIVAEILGKRIDYMVKCATRSWHNVSESKESRTLDRGQIIRLHHGETAYALKSTFRLIRLYILFPSTFNYIIFICQSSRHSRCLGRRNSTNRELNNSVCINDQSSRYPSKIPLHHLSSPLAK